MEGREKMVQRNEFYFEPRCVSEAGHIRWFGSLYSHERLLWYTGETVYIRDNQKELFVYSLEEDECSEEREIKAVFKLICKIKKTEGAGRYGKPGWK